MARSRPWPRRARSRTSASRWRSPAPQVVYPGLFAAAHRQTAARATPTRSLAYSDLFGSVVSDEKLKAAVQVDKNVLDFMAGDVARFQKSLPTGREGEARPLPRRLRSTCACAASGSPQMEDALKSAAPSIWARSSGRRSRPSASTPTSSSPPRALVGGLTQVVSIRADHLGMRLSGLGLGTKTVHHIGHMIEGKEGNTSGGGQDFDNGMGEFATRELIMDYHMQNVAKMAANLEASVPEGDGTMLDNTRGPLPQRPRREAPLQLLRVADGRPRQHRPAPSRPATTSTSPAGASPITAPSATSTRACCTPPACRPMSSVNQIEPCPIRSTSTDRSPSGWHRED